VKVTVVRGAGLTGMVRRSELDAAELPAREQEALLGLLERAGLAEAQGPGPPAAHADEMAYEIQVEGAGEPIVARFAESSLPDGSRALMAWVAEHPATRSRLAPPGH
jgi:hypothetical protein